MAYKRKPYRIKRSVKVVFWSFIALVVFSIANIFMNRPSTAKIVKPTLGDSPRAEEQAKTNTITAKHFSLNYDANLDTVSDISANDKAALEVYRVARSDVTGRRTLVITIKNLPAGGISEESSYRLRQIKPSEYRESNETFGETPFVVMQKTDGTELTGFSTYGGKLAMVAYTLNTPDADLRKEAAELLAAFKWLR